MSTDRDRGLLMDALVEGVGSQMPRGRVWNIDKALDALLPVVDRLANERAAAELRAAGKDLFAAWLIGPSAADNLTGRADVLDAK